MTKRRSFNVAVDEIDTKDGIQYNVRVVQMKRRPLRPGSRLSTMRQQIFPQGKSSPRCDSLDAVGDVVRDAITDGLFHAHYEDNPTGATP